MVLNWSVPRGILRQQDGNPEQSAMELALRERKLASPNWSPPPATASA